MIKKFFIMFVVLSSYCGTVNAGIVLGGTRVIYEEGKKEVSISLENKGSTPYLIQSWIENKDESKSKSFLITPPLFRLDGDKKNALRIFKLNDPLANDRETLFFLNVKSIPGGTFDGNVLQIAIRNRLKLIYRPATLKNESAETQTEKLKWTLSGNKLSVENPTPYYQNFMFVKIGSTDVDLRDKSYVAPFSTTHFDVSGVNAKKISWKIINDYGAIGPLHMSNI